MHSMHRRAFLVASVLGVTSLVGRPRPARAQTAARLKSIARDATGTVWCWGCNLTGVAGDVALKGQSTPVRIEF